MTGTFLKFNFLSLSFQEEAGQLKIAQLNFDNFPFDHLFGETSLLQCNALGSHFSRLCWELGINGSRHINLRRRSR